MSAVLSYEGLLMTYQQQRKVINTEQQQYLIEQAEHEFNVIAAQIDTDINWQKEKAFALQCLMDNDYLAQVAANNPLSLKQALLNLVTMELSLNPVLKHAYLVPRNNKVMLDVGYLGLIHQACKLGYVSEVQAKIIYQHDHYQNIGFYQEPHHTYSPFNDRGEALGCVVVAHTAKGSCLVEEMTQNEIYQVRARSKAYQAYTQDSRKLCPWVTDELEMWRKTTVKRAFKYWITDNRFTQNNYSEHDCEPSQKLAQPKQENDNVVQLLSREAKNLKLHIHDCLNMSELEQMAGYVRDSGLDAHEIDQLRQCWAQQRKKISNQ